MSDTLQLIRNSINGAPIRAAGEAMGKTVVITDEEVITGSAGIFGRWGAKLQRFPLTDLASIRAVPNPNANLLSLEFTGTSRETLTLMFQPDAQAAFETITQYLRTRLNSRQSGPR